MEFFFYLFFVIICLCCSFLVIFSSNPIDSVLWLILAFCNAAAFLFLYGLEFVAMLFLMVYVGAIIVLFLFVVMLLNVRQHEIQKIKFFYLPIGVVVGLFFFFEVVVLSLNNLSKWGHFGLSSLSWQNWFYLLCFFSQLEDFGYKIYTYYVDLFLLASIMLLVAMLGAIVLTVHTRKMSVRRQTVYWQTFRNFEQTIKFIK